MFNSPFSGLRNDCIVTVVKAKRTENKQTDADQGDTKQPINRTFRFPVMSELKALVLIATAISVFAVDFHYYPRRLCKTQAMGISLMDVGTGALIFVSGLTSRHFIHQDKSVLMRAWINIKVMPFLFALAFVLVITKWIVNHPEVVTEYGVHWNFFWTVCFINIFASFIKSFGRALYNGFVLLVVYQIFLNNGGADFVFNAPRVDFISKNKEGFFGCLGYCCIYLLGMGISSHVFNRENVEKFNVMNKRATVIAKTIGFMFLFYILSELADRVVHVKISRRLVNFPYAMFMSCLVCCCILFMYTFDSILKVRQFNYVVDVICSNQIVFFML